MHLENIIPVVGTPKSGILDGGPHWQHCRSQLPPFVDHLFGVVVSTILNPKFVPISAGRVSVHGPHPHIQ